MAPRGARVVGVSGVGLLCDLGQNALSSRVRCLGAQMMPGSLQCVNVRLVKSCAILSSEELQAFHCGLYIQAVLRPSRCCCLSPFKCLGE